MDCPYTRIDIIGQNGNDGDHYNVVPLERPEKSSNEEWEQLELDLPDPPEAA